jgi:hypothetical protein
LHLPLARTELRHGLRAEEIRLVVAASGRRFHVGPILGGSGPGSTFWGGAPTSPTRFGEHGQQRARRLLSVPDGV